MLSQGRTIRREEKPSRQIWKYGSSENSFFLLLLVRVPGLHPALPIPNVETRGNLSVVPSVNKSNEKLILAHLSGLVPSFSRYTHLTSATLKSCASQLSYVYNYSAITSSSGCLLRLNSGSSFKTQLNSSSAGQASLNACSHSDAPSCTWLPTAPVYYRTCHSLR